MRAVVLSGPNQFAPAEIEKPQIGPDEILLEMKGYVASLRSLQRGIYLRRAQDLSSQIGRASCRERVFPLV